MLIIPLLQQDQVGLDNLTFVVLMHVLSPPISGVSFCLFVFTSTLLESLEHVWKRSTFLFHHCVCSGSSLCSVPERVVFVQATMNNSTNVVVERRVDVLERVVISNYTNPLYAILFQEETQKTLEYFLVNFLRTFVNWTPAEDWYRGEVPTLTAGVEGSIYGDSSKTIVGCVHGHPTKVIFGLIRELKAVIQIFTACKYQWTEITY